MARIELFVKQAATYSKIRPTPPLSLVELIASATHQHERVWDCATGNGQAATVLAKYYKSVIATDISDGQLSHVMKHPNVTYRKMSATPELEELERIVGPEGSVDLVTVAQAMHWFDLDNFYRVVKHVLRKPGGLLAAWCYKLPRLNSEIDKLTDELYDFSAPYWDVAREMVDASYREVPFPFEPANALGVGPHLMTMTTEWNLDEYFLFWRSCSATQTALNQGVDLLAEEVQRKFSSAWGPAEQIRIVTFPLALLMGTVSSNKV